MIDEEQRKRRRGRIQASDSPAIVGVNGSRDPASGDFREWSNAYDVYLEKTAEVESLEETDPIEIGQSFEEPLLHWAARELGVEIQTNVEVVAPHSPVPMGANLDA